MSQDNLANQQQTLGDVQMEGDGNFATALQAGGDLNLTQIGTQIIKISENEVKTRQFIITSPDKGLKKFEPEDAVRFFGRDGFKDWWMSWNKPT